MEKDFAIRDQSMQDEQEEIIHKYVDNSIWSFSAEQWYYYVSSDKTLQRFIENIPNWISHLFLKLLNQSIGCY